MNQRSISHDSGRVLENNGVQGQQQGTYQNSPMKSGFFGFKSKKENKKEKSDGKRPATAKDGGRERMIDREEPPLGGISYSMTAVDLSDKS